MSDYEIRVFRHGESESFRSLFQTQHSMMNVDLERRVWWALENPLGGAFGVALSDSQVVSTCYVGGKQLLAATGPVLGHEIGETSTDPSHQRKGLFSRLVRACVAEAELQGSQVVYGTPNSQSTPGYSKLGFRITESEMSFLFLTPNFGYAFPQRVPLRKKITELTFGEYCSASLDLPRLNATSAQYLTWRFESSPNKYRFFLNESNGFLCALKLGQLRGRATVVCSEHFFVPRRFETERVGVHKSSKPELLAKLLRRVVLEKYPHKDFVAIQFHASLPNSKRALLLSKLNGVWPHRTLPICSWGIQAESFEADWFANFQLSDCDIG